MLYLEGVSIWFCLPKCCVNEQLDAPVILLDEPTSALDGDTSAAVMTALANLTRGKTVLHVSHRPETLTGCKRVLRLEGGQLYAP